MYVILAEQRPIAVLNTAGFFLSSSVCHTVSILSRVMLNSSTVSTALVTDLLLGPI